MRKAFFSILPAVLSVAVACSGGAGRKTASAPQSAPDGEEHLTRVTTASAVVQDVPQTDVYTSTVQATVTNNIAPQTGGRIQKLNVEVGDFVSKGQILAEMDRVQLEQARLKLVNDSTELSRLRGLFEEGGVSQSDFEALEMAYKVSRTSYQNLVENTVLRSPVYGVVSARNYDRGDMYTMAQPLYVVQQITPVKLLVGISETDYTKVKRGDVVEITADALPGRTFAGRVNRIYPTIDAVSHTFTAEVTVPNQDRALRPGMFARVKVTFGVNHSVVVPDGAVVKQQGSGLRMVFILDGNRTVHSSLVTLGRHFGTSYEILDGVQEGDVVAVRGASSLKDGAQVEVLGSNE